MEFADELRSRRDEAKKRLEAAKNAVTDAERDVALWQGALDAELRRNGSPMLDTSRVANQWFASVLEGYTPQPLKEDLFREALRSAGRPLTPAEITRALKPHVSRSYVYYLVDQLQNTKEIGKDEHGGIYLKEKGEPKSAPQD